MQVADGEVGAPVVLEIVIHVHALGVGRQHGGIVWLHSGDAPLPGVGITLRGVAEGDGSHRCDHRFVRRGIAEGCGRQDMCHRGGAGNGYKSRLRKRGGVAFGVSDGQRHVIVAVARITNGGILLRGGRRCGAGERPLPRHGIAFREVDEVDLLTGHGFDFRHRHGAGNLDAVDVEIALVAAGLENLVVGTVGIFKAYFSLLTCV